MYRLSRKVVVHIYIHLWHITLLYHERYCVSYIDIAAVGSKGSVGMYKLVRTLHTSMAHHAQLSTMSRSLQCKLDIATVGVRLAFIAA
jgi:hypothetical protein